MVGFSTTLFFALLTWHAGVMHDTPVRRYALLFSADQGNAGEPNLLYSHNDVDLVASALRDVVGVHGNDIVELQDSTAATVRDAFHRLRARAATEGRGNSESMLFVYYSGHADATTLHLQGTALPWEELLQLVREVNVTTRVMLVDACRSGVLTEIKGLARDPEPVMLTRQELPKGLAIMTSASAGEVAQESPDIQGSFFTNHFVAALRGAADRNQDGRITLTEAFEYASSRTSQSTATTMAGVQHATYRFALQGRHELVLSTSGQWSHSGALVRLVLPGSYVFQRGSIDGPVVLEVSIPSERTMVIPGGTYYVRRRTIDHLYKGAMVTARADGSAATVLVNEVESTPTMVSLKGTSAIDTPDKVGSGTYIGAADDSVSQESGREAHDWSFEAFAGTAGSIMPQYRTPIEAGVMATAYFKRFALDLQFMYGHDNAQTVNLSTTQNEMGVMVGLRYLLLDADLFSLSAGGRAGALYISQQFDVNAGFANAIQLAPELQGVVRGELHFTDSFYLALEGSARGVVYKAYDNNNGVTSPQHSHFSMAPMGTLALGFTW